MISLGVYSFWSSHRVIDHEVGRQGCKTGLQYLMKTSQETYPSVGNGGGLFLVVEQMEGLDKLSEKSITCIKH
jgi:hypothetical protein